MTNMQYIPIPSTALTGKTGHEAFQACYEHISGLLGEHWFPTSNASQLQGITYPAMTVWRLWWFAAEVAGNGMSAWVLNCSPHAQEIIDSHAALATVGADSLKQLLEAAIPIAAEQDAEFLREPESQWFLQFPKQRGASDMDTIDSMSLQLAAEPLSDLVAQYIHANLEAF